MNSLVSFLLSYVLIYKYAAIFVITFLGALALPLPSGAVVAASSAFSIQGYMSLPAVIITAILGNIAGDNCGYWIARKFGLEALEKLHLKKLISREKREWARIEIGNHPILIIFFSRFMTGIAPTVNVVSGLTKLLYRKFLLFESLGEFAEVGFFSALGYFLGANWEYLTRFSGASWAVMLSGALLTYFLWHLFLRSKRKNKPRTTGQRPGTG